MKPAARKGKLGRGLGGVLILLLGLAGGGLIALSPDIALPMAILMLPGLLALILDSSPGCGLARAMLLMQSAACVHPLSDAWYRCAGVDGCVSYLAEPTTIMWAWMAAAGGWVTTQVLPLGLKFLDDLRLRQRQEALALRRDAIAQEWGLE